MFLIVVSAIRADELEKDETPQIGTAFYKLEIITIQLVSAYGNQACADLFLLFNFGSIAGYRGRFVIL